MGGKFRRGWVVLLLVLGTSAAFAAAPVAEDDAYETAAGDNLSVDAPGVLENDHDDDGDSLTAILVDDPASGGVVYLFDDGSFEYEPPTGFVGVDTFTYRAFDGGQTSNLATVTVTVSGTPQFAVYLDESAFLVAAANLGYTTTTESFEDDEDWGSVRSSISGGNFLAPSIHSMGIRWAANNEISQVTTGNGPARTGSWGFFALPHGDYGTGVDCHIPGNCTPGFVLTGSPTLYGVGVWLIASWGSSIEFILDGTRLADFGDGSGLGSVHKFFGVIDPAGFHSLEIHELEGTTEDAKYLWADDFTIVTPQGITMSVREEAAGSAVRLQWLGGQPVFSVFRSTDPATVLEPGNLLGQTSSRSWSDDPPVGEVFYFEVSGP